MRLVLRGWQSMHTFAVCKKRCSEVADVRRWRHDYTAMTATYSTQCYPIRVILTCVAPHKKFKHRQASPSFAVVRFRTLSKPAWILCYPTVSRLGNNTAFRRIYENCKLAGLLLRKHSVNVDDPSNLEWLAKHHRTPSDDL
jgi:hypothetical protein